MGAEPDKPDPEESGEQAPPWWQAIRNLRELLRSTPRGKNDPARGVILDVYLEIADSANADGQCWPGIKTLAEKCRVSERSVLASIALLSKHGVLTMQKRSTGTGGGKGSKPALITLSRPYQPNRTKLSILHDGVETKLSNLHDGQDQHADFRTTNMQNSVCPPAPPNKVEHVPRTKTLSPDGSLGVSVETARKGSARKPSKETNPLEYPPFALFWTNYPACKHKDAPGRMYPAFQVFRKAEKQPGFNVDNLLTALREAAKQCNDLDFFPAPKAWLESRPWLDVSTPKPPDPEAAKREERLRRTREKLDQETIPE